MSFVTVRDNTRGRFVENQIFLNYITSLETREVKAIIPIEVNMMKGLFYVHLYSSLEKSITELVETTLIHISSKSVQFNHFNLPFHSISLVDKLKSFKGSGYNNFFTKSHEIFNELSSKNTCTLNESIFASNLQNIWTKTVEEICKSFGIKTFVVTPRTKATIDEIVEKRNAVAHGRESAKVVGERFRTDILRSKMDILIEFSNYLIDLFEKYYAQKDYLKPIAKKYYT